MVDYRDTPEETEFRLALRKWLEENAPKGWQDIEDPDEEAKMRRAWHRKLYEAGYLGQSWPVEYGGKGLGFVYDAILNDEAGSSDAPSLPSMINYLGRAIMAYTSPEMGTRFLPRMLSGEDQWCQGYSEPMAGSDLASLRTRAVRDGDTYVINGQKMWTSFGQYADWCMLLARTDPDVPKHKGISCFLVSMKSPGVTVRPIVLANGEPETCEVFWDDVVVPADQIIGNEGDGWRIAMTTFMYERGPADVGIIASYRKMLRKVEELAVQRGLDDDPEIRAGLAKAYMRGEVLRLNVARQLSLRLANREAGEESSIAKLLWGEAEQELQHLVLRMIGPDAVSGAEEEWMSSYLRSRPVSVYGGSEQIQKNIIANRILAMPRG